MEVSHTAFNLAGVSLGARALFLCSSGRQGNAPGHGPRRAGGRAQGAASHVCLGSRAPLVPQGRDCCSAQPPDSTAEQGVERLDRHGIALPTSASSSGGVASQAAVGQCSLLGLATRCHSVAGQCGEAQGRAAQEHASPHVCSLVRCSTASTVAQSHGLLPNKRARRDSHGPRLCRLGSRHSVVPHAAAVCGAARIAAETPRLRAMLAHSSSSTEAAAALSGDSDTHLASKCVLGRAGTVAAWSGIVASGNCGARARPRSRAACPACGEL
jgi:hypothetical protein